ncbi:MULTISPECIES: EpsG family protein [unclassified Campylobacter]|uniref:EpsG family protein n=1 Tax=unclassified Campylobacter TaxID=2593542 RepID=UPI0022E9B53D|nr:MULTISPECIES: EpsG family protein [unclassified Campylobacter]MDA3054606.1 EpsG family protein [Campylobacter sp. VBCF_07 NA4]MDA3060610.1 EpsG family protein [Campylobacter sp. VBCF_02 NA5]MDA3070124.1 EpsG family protein [Campylobacter sp. VBCF_08 NA3]WBR54559.1 EpsG family protein [Campylobacter sp. VBCF_01 NA2]
MIFYIAIYISASLFIFLYSKTENKNLAFIFKWTSFLILFVPLALRYNIGIDYPHYMNLITSGQYLSDWEISWILFVKLIYALNLDIHWFFVVPAFLSLLIFFNLFEKKYLWVAVIVYIFYYYTHSYVFVRQDFALVVFLIAVKYFLAKKRLAMLFWIIISCLFHKSIIFNGIVLLMCEINFKFFNTRVNLFILACIFALQYINLADLFMNYIIRYTPYANYEFSEFNRDAEIATGLGIFIYFAIFALIFAFQTKYDFKSYLGRFYNLTCIFLFYLAISRVLMKDIFIFHRLADSSAIALIFGSISLLISKTKYSKYALFVVLFLLFAMCIKITSNADINAIGATRAIIPYQSIFQR